MPRMCTAKVAMGGVSRTERHVTTSLLFNDSRVRGTIHVVGSLVSRGRVTGTRSSRTRSQVSCLTSVLKLDGESIVSMIRHVQRRNVLTSDGSVSTCLRSTNSSRQGSRILLRHFTGLRRCVLGRVPSKALQVSYGRLGRGTIGSNVGASGRGSVQALLCFLAIGKCAHGGRSTTHGVRVDHRTSLRSAVEQFRGQLRVDHFTIR